MGDDAVVMIGDERAGFAPLRPGWIEHEVIYDELTFIDEQIGERFLAGRRVEAEAVLRSRRIASVGQGRYKGN